MCKTKRDTVAADPKPKPQPRTPKISSSGSITTPTISSSFPTAAITSFRNPSSFRPSSSSSSTSLASFASLKDFLPDNTTFYLFSEICSATNNLLSRNLSSSSSWRCTLRGKDTVVFQRRFRGDPSRLASICKIHHGSIVRLLGASFGYDYNYIYLVYDYVHGASLADCLRNPRNPNYTPLATWASRMQVAKDLADGLAYIHCYSWGGTTPSSDRCQPCGPVHNRIKSSSVIITDPHLRAKICHVGAAVLSGDAPDEEVVDGDDENRKTGEISSPVTTKQRRSDSLETKIEGTRGYMAPEILAGGSISQKSDVFAFGVVLLELLSGEEPLKYRFDSGRKYYMSVSLIETARAVMVSEKEGEGKEERRHRIRRWIDWRLRDSFPVEVAEKVLHLALDCVHVEAGKRPEMARVAGKVSKLFIESEKWTEKFNVPTEFTVSMAPR